MIVMIFTEKVRSTLEESLAAAIHTLPSDGSVAVLFTSFLSSSKSFKLTRSANQLFFGCILFQIELLFAIHEASKVRHRAFSTFVERTAMQGKVLELSVEIVTLCCESRILV